MHTFVLVIHIILAVLMIGLILVQHGKGAAPELLLEAVVRQPYLVLQGLVTS